MRNETAVCTCVGVRGLAAWMCVCVQEGWDDWKVKGKKEICVAEMDTAAAATTTTTTTTTTTNTTSTTIQHGKLHYVYHIL
jgi:hypothetical protein